MMHSAEQSRMLRETTTKRKRTTGRNLDDSSSTREETDDEPNAGDYGLSFDNAELIDI